MSVVITRRGNVIATVAAANYVERETQTFGGQPFVGDWLLYDKATPTERTLVGVVSAADFTVIEIKAATPEVPVSPLPGATGGTWTSPPFAPTIHPTSPPYRYGDPASTIGVGVSGTIGTATTHNLPEPVVSGPLFAGLGDDSPDA